MLMHFKVAFSVYLHTVEEDRIILMMLSKTVTKKREKQEKKEW